jgi:GDP-mannose 6-dehydrogenase
MKVAVFGLGYVGTVTAACLASSGHTVTGVDVDQHKVDMIRSGRSPVIEPGLDDLVAGAIAAGALDATTSPAEALDGADVSLLCVGTPSMQTGATDLTFITRAVEEIAECLAAQTSWAPHAVAVRSTVPPGTVEGVILPILDAALAGSGRDYGAAMCPEFLREGSGISDFFGPPFTVIGTSNPTVAATITDLFASLECPVHVVQTRAAEALKYACNAFHATKVSFANELSRLFRTLDVDSREVMEIFCLDDHLNISPRYLRPGFAFGGSCLPKDLRSLLHLGRMNSLDMPMLSGVLSTNHLAIGDVVDRLVMSDARTVALLGLSFKMSSDDLRESPYVDLAETLIGKGFDVRIYDPIVNPQKLIGTNRRYVESKLPHLHRILAASAAEALAGADVAVVSSSDPQVTAALVEHAPPRVIDLSGQLGAEVELLRGYEGVGW